MSANKYDVPQPLLDELENQRFIVDGAQMGELKRLFVEQREPLRWLCWQHEYPAVQSAGQEVWRVAYRIEQIVAKFRVFEIG